MVNGFTVLKEEELAYFRGKGIWVRHDRTGLEIFKFVTDKINNYFCFNFKTPIEDDRGIAHILEHSVLHGSRKFPDSELFFKLQQKSPCKDLNASTSKTSTSFFAETCVPKDFYNLLDIMGDSVFFPLLTDETFMQEGWRIEKDEKGSLKINGVVFNEMNNDDEKAAFAYRKLNRDFQPGSNENNIQGGDPLHIPECSVEDIREFHRKYYVPKNCFLFLFGNIDFEEQLKFLEEKLLSKLPAGTERALNNDNVIPFKELQEFEISVPHYGTSEAALELRFSIEDGDRDEINTRDDFFNLLSYKLTDELIAPKYGTYGDVDTFGTSMHRVFTITLYGVDRKDIPDAKKYLMSLFERVAEKGIDSETVEFFCTNQDYNFEDNEFDIVPTALNDPCFSGWNESYDPFVNLVDPESFWIRDKELFSKAENNLFENMTKKYFIDNPHKAFVVMIPDENYFQNLEEMQNKHFDEIIRSIPESKINSDIEKFNMYQRECLEGKHSHKFPEVKISDLPLPQDVGLADVEKIKTDKGEVFIFSSVQEIMKKTNFSICFPLDVLLPEELFLFIEGLPFFKKLGFGDNDVKDSFQILSNESVDINEYGFDAGNIPVYETRKEIFENRYWLNISFSIFNRKIKEGLALIAEYIFNKNFNDVTYINQFKLQYSNYLQQIRGDKAPLYGAHYIHAQCTARLELHDYLNSPQIPSYYKQMQKLDMDELISKTIDIHRKVISSGAVFNVFASKEQIENSKAALIEFIKYAGFNELKPALKYDACWLRKEMKLPEKIQDGFEINTIVTKEENNSSIAIFNASQYPSKEYAAEDALMQWFSNTVLYEQIRKCNGAYDVSAGSYASDGTVRFQTQRDPEPLKSIELYQKSLEQLSHKKFIQEELNDIVIRTYGLAVSDISPKERGSLCFSRCLSALLPEYRKQRLQNLLDLTVKDLEDAAKRLYEYSKNMKAIVVTNDESNSAGNILTRIE